MGGADNDDADDVAADDGAQNDGNDELDDVRIMRAKTVGGFPTDMIYTCMRSCVRIYKHSQSVAIIALGVRGPSVHGREGGDGKGGLFNTFSCS